MRTIEKLPSHFLFARNNLFYFVSFFAQIRVAQINWMVDVTVVAEDIVVQDLDHGLNEFSNSFSLAKKKKKHEQNMV